MTDRLYCTVADLRANPGEAEESALLEYIREASQEITREIGDFIPFIEAKTFNGYGEARLEVEPLISISSLTDDGDAITSTQWNLQPANPKWENGCYTALVIDEDAGELSVWTKEVSSVVITGSWGKYAELVTVVIANITLNNATATSLLITNGSRMSPGMVLLIEDEQILVEAFGATTNSTTTVDGAIAIDDEEIAVASGSAVKVGEVIEIDLEDMLVVKINSNAVLVVRGYNETLKATHANAATINVYRTFTIKRGVNGSTAAAHASVAVSRYVAPSDIFYLCKQMAGLRMRLEETGFSGKVGGGDSGEPSYITQRPKNFEAVKKRYMLPRI